MRFLCRLPFCTHAVLLRAQGGSLRLQTGHLRLETGHLRLQVCNSGLEAGSVCLPTGGRGLQAGNLGLERRVGGLLFRQLRRELRFCLLRAAARGRQALLQRLQGCLVVALHPLNERLVLGRLLLQLQLQPLELRVSGGGLLLSIGQTGCQVAQLLLSLLLSRCCRLQLRRPLQRGR